MTSPQTFSKKPIGWMKPCLKSQENTSEIEAADRVVFFDQKTETWEKGTVIDVIQGNVQPDLSFYKMMYGSETPLSLGKKFTFPRYLILREGLTEETYVILPHVYVENGWLLLAQWNETKPSGKKLKP